MISLVSLACKMKGDPLKGPSTAAYDISLRKYWSVLSVCKVAPVWFLGMYLGVGGLPFMLIGHSYKIRSHISMSE